MDDLEVLEEVEGHDGVGLDDLDIILNLLDRA